ncbi:MAG: EamA family transporter [Verrucomicrobia bacterium]|nr:EamA family transporter [Verrucomicrobiota bacterium]
MTFFFFCLIVFSVASTVTGQVFFKHAMSDQSSSSQMRRRLDLSAGVLAMTAGFFTWLALLHRFDLSYLYPFEGLDRVLLAFAAWLILKERITRDLWIGVILICVGTALVAGS